MTDEKVKDEDTVLSKQEKSRLLNYKDFSLLYYTENQRLEDITKLFYKDIKGDRGDLRLWKAVKLVFENLIAANYKLISIPLDKRKLYLTPGRYNPGGINAIHLRKIVNYLSERDYIKHERYVNYANFKVPTRIKAKMKLKKLLMSTGLEKETLELDRETELIVLKSKTKYFCKKDKKYKDFKHKRKFNIKIDYEDDTRTRSMRKFLKKQNLFLKKHDFKIGDKKIEVFFRRIFNDSFKAGGRFYAQFQSLKSSLDKCEGDEMSREELMINGEESIEIDYSGMHINMLYIDATGQLFNDGDVYTVEGYEKYRDVFKICLQVVINAKDKTAALKGMNNHLRKIDCDISSKELLELFEQKHEKIKHFFYTGEGLKLQYKDSKIAKRIFAHFQKINAPVLSVHDSFIVSASYKDELIEQMRESSLVVLKAELEIDIKEKSESYKKKYKEDYDNDIQPLGPIIPSFEELVA